MESRSMTANRKLKRYSILFIALNYIYPALFYFLLSALESEAAIQRSFLILLVPAACAVWNLIFVIRYRNDLDPVELYRASIRIKYGLVPFYALGGILVALCWASMLMPIVVTVFIGPMLALTLSAIGYMSVLAAAPITVPALCKDEDRSLVSSVGRGIGIVCQFFFVADVVTFAVISIRKNIYRKLSIGIIAAAIIGVLLAAILGVGMLVIMFAGR